MTPSLQRQPQQRRRQQQGRELEQRRSLEQRQRIQQISENHSSKRIVGTHSCRRTYFLVGLYHSSTPSTPSSTEKVDARKQE